MSTLYPSHHCLPCICPSIVYPISVDHHCLPCIRTSIVYPVSVPPLSTLYPSHHCLPCIRPTIVYPISVDHHCLPCIRPTLVYPVFVPVYPRLMRIRLQLRSPEPPGFLRGNDAPHLPRQANLTIYWTSSTLYPSCCDSGFGSQTSLISPVSWLVSCRSSLTDSGRVVTLPVAGQLATLPDTVFTTTCTIPINQSINH